MAYASQAWFANKTELKEIERVQKKATSWILSNWDLSYKKRLEKLNLLPLSLYLELHYLLLLIDFTLEKYNIKIPITKNEKCDVQTTRQNELIYMHKTRTKRLMRISGEDPVN